MRLSRLSTTLPRIAAVVLCASSTLSAQALSILPERPSSCDDLVLVATRTVNSDCNWSVRAHAVNVFERRFDFELELVPASEICLPVVLEETFSVSLGSFPPGEWQFSFSWVDGHPVDLRSLLVTVDSEDCGPGFRLSDSNGDGRADIADAVSTLTYLFGGGTLPCVAAADADRNETVEITDAIFTLNWLFAGGPSPVPSPRVCTPVDPASRLDCETPSCETGFEDGSVWVAMPDGCLQCSPCPPIFAEDIARDLESEGFTVLDAVEGFISVCEACTCPSGRYFILRVPTSDLAALRERGWGIWGSEQPFVE